MAGEVIILDIGGKTVGAGVFGGRPRYEPLAFFSEPVEGSAAGSPAIEPLRTALTALLEKMRAKGYDGKAPARVLAGLPGTILSIRIVELPFEEKRKIAEALPFELGGMLHVDVENTVMGARAVGGGKVMAVVVEKAVLREYLAMLAGLGLDPFWIGPATFSVTTLLAELYGAEGVKAYIGPESLVVSENGRLRFYKPVRTLEGVKLGLAYLEAEGISVDSVYTTGWDIGDIKSLLPQVKEAGELAALPGGFPPEGAAIYGLSLELKKGLLDETVNFRSGEFAYTRERMERRRGLRYTAAALAVALVLLGGDIYLRYLRYSAELQGYRETLRSTYLQLFPEERAVTDEVYSLQVKIKGLQEELAVLGGGPGVLDVLNSLARAGADSHKVRFTEVFVGGGRVTAKGETGSFEGADYLKETYLKDPLFKDVRLSDVKAAPGGGVVFSITITLGGETDGVQGHLQNGA